MKRFMLFLSVIFAYPTSLFSEDFINNPAYIAQKGFGSSQTEAENAALASLSKFFQMSIAVEAKEYTTVTNAASQSTMSEDISVKSETDLFAVHYTKAKFDKKQKLYEVTAYIDREEGWRIYKPRLEEAIRPFEKFYSDAQNQSEPILQIVGFSKALKSARETELSKKCDFAMILNPDEMTFYEQSRENLSELQPRIRKLCSKCSVFISCETDYENRIEQAVAAYFSACGISVSKNENSTYKVIVTVNENSQTLPAGMFFTPSYKFEIIGDGNIFFSCAKELKKTGAKNEAVAKQRAFSAVATSIKQNLNEEFASF